MANSQGNFQLNVFKPLIAYNMLESIELLAGGCQAFDQHCIIGLQPDEHRIAELVERSLMLVTALTPKIGYDRASEIAKYAHEHSLTLRDAALQVAAISGEEFDRCVQPKAMVHPTS
jgi:fumarate hydratase class II